MRTLRFSEGDRVAYAASFLRQIGCQTGEIPFLRGIVKSTRKIGQRDYVSVLWGGDDKEKLANPSNLTKVTAKQGIIDN